MFRVNPGPREPEGATALARDHPTPMSGLRLSRPPAQAGALGIAEGTEGQGQSTRHLFLQTHPPPYYVPPFLQSHYVLGPRMLWHKRSARPPIHFSVLGSETLTGGRHVSTIPSTYVYIYIYMYRNVNAYYSAAADTGCFCCLVSCLINGSCSFIDTW